MSEPEQMAQEQIRDIVRELEGTRYRLLGVEATLPPGPVEMARLLENEEMDARTEIRAAIQHTLRELIEPAIWNLRVLEQELKEKG
ncbi:MAG TPA: hypothetical protein VGX68_14280 [Thermoanaerobaculia bacterium]|nr:hypothetical protein [Thermoanaerobaculia bacterium]